MDRIYLDLSYQKQHILLYKYFDYNLRMHLVAVFYHENTKILCIKVLFIYFI